MKDYIAYCASCGEPMNDYCGTVARCAACGGRKAVYPDAVDNGDPMVALVWVAIAALAFGLGVTVGAWL